MRKTILHLSVLFLLLSSCTQQVKTEPTTLFNEDFNWTITIPENFINVSPKDWAKMQNKGLNALEDTYGEVVVNQANIIFVFKNADFNYMESNYQPFDTEIDGDYIESCRGVNEIIHKTFEVQMPNAKIDSTTSIEVISGLDFQTFTTKIDFPNGLRMYGIMYSRLFDKKEFSVNIIYVDEKQGEKMIEAWKNSKFE